MHDDRTSKREDERDRHGDGADPDSMGDPRASLSGFDFRVDGHNGGDGQSREADGALRGREKGQHRRRAMSRARKMRVLDA